MIDWCVGGIGPSGWLGIGVFWLILLGLIAWAVIRLLPDSSNETAFPTGESALENLDRRLGGGEIDMGAWDAQRTALLAARDDRHLAAHASIVGQNGPV